MILGPNLKITILHAHTSSFSSQLKEIPKMGNLWFRPNHRTSSYQIWILSQGIILIRGW